MEQDDRRYLDALDAKDVAQAALDQLTGAARDHRDELAEFVAAVDALRLNVEPWPVEGFETFDVVRGWEAASFEQQRNLVTMALDRITVSEDGSTSWSFKRGLVQPLDLPALISPGQLHRAPRLGRRLAATSTPTSSTTRLPPLAPLRRA